MRVLILILLVSCGKQDQECMSMEEATLRCKADLIQEYYPGRVPDMNNRICETSYPVQGCY